MVFGCVCFGHLYVQMDYVKNIHEFSMEFDMLTLEVKYIKILKSIDFIENYKMQNFHQNSQNAYFSREKHASVIACGFPWATARFHRRSVSPAHGFLTRARQTLHEAMTFFRWPF